MPLFDAQLQLAALSRHLQTHSGLIVACYCAAWCDTCGQYRPGFEALAERFPEHVFVWVDIEECEPLLDDEDVENFPTLLVQSSKGNLFFGPLPPHPEQLERLLQGLAQNPATLTGGPRHLHHLIVDE